MPATKRVHRRLILEAAVRTIRRGGAPALTMRNIAKELGCSTQPIYSEFTGQEELYEALADFLQQEYLAARCSSYRDYGRVFLRFAREEKELFRFLYLRRRAPEHTFLEDANWEQTLALLTESLELSREQAEQLHRRMQYYCYGLGVMIATGYRTLDDEQIDRELADFFSLLLGHYKGADSEAALERWRRRARQTTL